MRTKFILIGGFLGAGKTTLIGQLARRYVDDGKTVAIITNDQADNLVDTHNLRSRGFDVGEVAGACFCCSFDELVATAGKLGSGQIPDVILAEPVGSCTDLVATVVLPLQQSFGDRFEMTPFGVLLKPSHGKRILAKVSSDSANDSADKKNTRSGFSPQAEYLFLKQLEEADYLMIGRSDELSVSQISELRDGLAKVAKGVPVVAVSPKTGAGIDEVLGYIESPMVAGRRLLSIDYDTYADGEADLGWVNLTAHLQPQSDIHLDDFVQSLIGSIADAIRKLPTATIAHVKASLITSDTQAIANVISNDSPVELGLSSGRSAGGVLQVVVNARVAIDPSQLEALCQASLEALALSHAAKVSNLQSQAFRPGRPTPTHRVTASG